MTTATPSPETPAGHDLIDQIVGLSPGQGLHATRHVREKIAAATQRSYALFLDTEGAGLTHRDKLLVAWYACLLSGATELARHYRAELRDGDVDPGLETAILKDTLFAVPPGRLATVLAFTRKLILTPIEGNRAAIDELHAAGIATPDIVMLAQWIGFLSYQIRVVAGLKAMKALEAK